MKLNNKGFTLVEVLAVIIILGVIFTISVPTVNHIINQNVEDNYKKLKEGIINATKIYLSDNRYNIRLNGSCGSVSDEVDIKSINDIPLTNSKVPIKTLVDNNYLSTKNNKIENPKNKKEKLDLENSYVLVEYLCSTKDYKHSLADDDLKWQ